jgi:DNA invertase Pin-like site-specific DNA recombinase
MRAAVYARVSTVNNGQSPEMQLRELGEYCDRRGWTIAGEYVDVGISGAKEKRPELDRLIADAHRRRFDAVVVWKFDRFARSVSHLLRALENFQALGIEFVSLTEGVDTSTPAGKLVFTVLGAVAELERSLIAERVKAGLRNARAKGQRLGRPRKVVDAFRIAALRAGGRSWRTIARQLGCSARTARRALQKARQKGKSGDSATHTDKNSTSHVKVSAAGANRRFYRAPLPSKEPLGWSHNQGRAPPFALPWPEVKGNHESHRRRKVCP